MATTESTAAQQHLSRRVCGRLQIEVGIACSDRGEHEGEAAQATRSSPSHEADVAGGVEDVRHDDHELGSCKYEAMHEHVQGRPAHQSQTEDVSQLAAKLSVARREAG